MMGNLFYRKWGKKVVQGKTEKRKTQLLEICDKNSQNEE